MAPQPKGSHNRIFFFLRKNVCRRIFFCSIFQAPKHIHALVAKLFGVADNDNDDDTEKKEFCAWALNENINNFKARFFTRK